MSRNRYLGTSARSIIVPSAAALVVVIVALALATGSGTSSSKDASTVVSGQSASIKISNFMYSPDSITVRVGTRVRVTNRDGTAHTLTADSGAFDTGTIAPGRTKSIVFRKPGTFTFHCTYHAFMTGTIKVIGG